jgi:hypothetical protein
LRWNLALPRPELYTNFGGDFYLSRGGLTGFGSAPEVLDRIQRTYDEALDRGKVFTIPEWGVWTDHGITQADALDFVQDLVALLSGMPSLLYWNHFYGKEDTSLKNFPAAEEAWLDALRAVGA